MNSDPARFTGALLNRWRNPFSFSRTKSKPQHLRLGVRGEKLVFVEVKTRTSEDFGRPIEAIRRSQRQRISLGGLAWLRLLDNPDILFRFDVVEVVIAPEAAPRLELIRNAFQLPDRYIY